MAARASTGIFIDRPSPRNLPAGRRRVSAMPITRPRVRLRSILNLPVRESSPPPARVRFRTFGGDGGKARLMPNYTCATAGTAGVRARWRYARTTCGGPRPSPSSTRISRTWPGTLPRRASTPSTSRRSAPRTSPYGPPGRRDSCSAAAPSRRSTRTTARSSRCERPRPISAGASARGSSST